MKNQMELFTGLELRNQGIKRAIDNADDKNENWSEKAYRFLEWYCKDHDHFLAEEVRLESDFHDVPLPPSKRSWGGIIVRAKNNGLIKSIGFRSVKNSKAHMTPATLWEVIK